MLGCTSELQFSSSPSFRLLSAEGKATHQGSLYFLLHWSCLSELLPVSGRRQE